MSRYGRMDFVSEMDFRKGLEFYNYAVEQRNNHYKILLSPFMSSEDRQDDNNHHENNAEDGRTADNILKGVEDILNGNI